MDGLNVWAVLVAAISSFLLGGVWYSVAVIGRVWNREAGRGDKVEGGHPARVFGLSFVFALIAAAALLNTALLKGLMAGVCFAATSFGINYQFANRSTKMWLIDGGYHSAQFALFGLMLGLWH